MSVPPIDVVVLSVVLVLVIIAIRSIMRSKGSCSSCANAGTCSAAHKGGSCPVASATISNAQARLTHDDQKSDV